MKKSPLTQIQNDKELLSWMRKHLSYHGVVKNFLFTPEEVIEKGLAHCWESTELERRELHYLGYKCNTIMLTTDNASVTHTALVYIKDEKYYWFEWAWHKYEGIHGPFDNKHDIVNYIINLFIKHNGYKIHCFYGYMHINKNETAKEYFQRAEQCENIKINTSNHSQYKEIPLTENNLNKYKHQYYGLSHIRTGSDYTGIILTDKGDKFVAVLSINKKQHDIQGIDINNEYRGKGLAIYLLNIAVKRYSVRHLTVRQTNKRAIEVYKKFGFVEIKKEGIMIYMDYKPNKKKLSLEDW